MQDKATCCNQECNQGRDCPARLTKLQTLTHYTQVAEMAQAEQNTSPTQAAPVAAMTNALREAEAALEVALARILKADPGHSTSVTSEAKALVAVRQALSAKAAPVAVGEREAFEQAFIAEKLRLIGCNEPDSEAVRAIRMCHLQRYSDGEYPSLEAYFAWFAWQTGRAALAATPAAAAPMVDMTPPATSRDRWMYEQGRLAERDARTHGNVAAAAPVVLPEPFALYDGEKWYANEETAICSCADMEKLQKVFIESQLLTLLAGVSAPAVQAVAFQQRVQPWMMACFGPEISADRIERNHRFLEESLELVQSLGCTASEAHQLVDYVFGRPVGEPVQEAGGVMVTLAALCLASGLDMHACGETELARIWTKVEAIRAKQAAKPKHSPLPMHAPQAQADARDAAPAATNKEKE